MQKEIEPFRYLTIGNFYNVKNPLFHGGYVKWRLNRNSVWDYRMDFQKTDLILYEDLGRKANNYVPYFNFK